MGVCIRQESKNRPRPTTATPRLSVPGDGGWRVLLGPALIVRGSCWALGWCGTSSDQSGDEGHEQGFAPMARIVNELEAARAALSRPSV
jgi:hypothetical protein